MRLAQAGEELRWLGELPGRKILVKGNHDYWWESLSKVRKALPAGAHALRNDALLLDGVAFAGARGWVDPTLDFRILSGDAPSEQTAAPEPLFGIRGPEEDERIYRNELDRLEASLRRMDPRAKLRLALLHFPPTSPGLEETPVTRLLEKYGVDAAAFGHLHGAGWARFENPYGIRGGVRYYLVSADFAHFKPVRIAETG
jgi:predicted phosphohydrolase